MKIHETNNSHNNENNNSCNLNINQSSIEVNSEFSQLSRRSLSLSRSQSMHQTAQCDSPYSVSNKKYNSNNDHLDNPTLDTQNDNQINKMEYHSKAESSKSNQPISIDYINS